MDVQSLQDELKHLARNRGADFFGVANLAPAQDFVSRQGGTYFATLPTGVSIGIRLLDAVVDELSQHDNPTVIYTYRALYTTVNTRLDYVAVQVAKHLQAFGFRAYPIPASQTVDAVQLYGAFSHKLAAHLAGLGWIGKSCLLITPQCGPRVRLATVLTDAPLPSDSPLDNSCQNCSTCVDACPVNAFTGVPFTPSEPREARFHAHRCQHYSDKRTEKLGEGLCGLCVFVCPYGQHK